MIAIMERLYRVGDFLKRNKDIIQPLTTLALCVLVALLYLFPTRTQTVIVQNPPASPTESTGKPAPEVKEVESATTTLSPSNIYTNGTNPESLEQNNTTQQPGSSGSSSGGGTATTPKPPTTTPQLQSCSAVTSGGGPLTIEYDKSALYSGARFTVTLSTTGTIPLGNIFMAPTGNFIVSPSTLNSTSTTASFIAQYEGGYTPVPDVTPTDAISITSRCGGATFTGIMNLL